MKLKIYNIVIITILFGLLLQAQTKKDYKKLYKEYFKDVKNEHTFEKKTKDFFKQFNDEELAVAISEISRDEDVNFIVHQLFSPNHKKIKEKSFRKKILTQLKEKDNPPNFKLVLIDFISDEVLKNDDERELFNNELFNIAENKNFPDNLRAYAASHAGKSTNYKENKIKFKKLLEIGDTPVINGAAHSISNYLLSEAIDKSEKDYWTDLLITTAQKHSNELEKIKPLIATLGYSKSNKSKNYLLKLFKENTKKKTDLTEAIVYSLSNSADEEVINTIFDEYNKNKEFDDFGSELTLKHIANENKEIVDKLNNNSKRQSKLNYLRAIRVMNPAERNKRIEQVVESLNSKYFLERLESVKTLHFILPYEEEVKLFRNHLKEEKNEAVKKEIYSYIGQ